MGKKIIDILPPARPSREKVKKKVEEFPPEKEPELEISPPGRRLKKGLILICLILILTGIAGYFRLPRVEIEIWPETEIRTFETKITVDKTFAFEEERNFTQEFSSTGKKLTEKKAEGVIRVFNDFHSDQILIAQTRFQPPLEKFRPALETGENPWFRTTERIVIPAKSHRDVRVVADAPGEKYNIEPSTFSVPGLAGTPQYTFVYGKSFETMRGGFKKEAPEVTSRDLEEAEKLLREKAAEEIKGALRNKLPAGFVVPEEGFKTEILETFSAAEAGAELEKFTFQVKAKAQALSFREEDLENFAKEFIKAEIPGDKEFDQKSLKIDYSAETINLKEGIINLSLKLEVKIYSAINETVLKAALVGKSLEESQLFLQYLPEINRAKVKLWPFWVKTVPQEIERIDLKLIVD